MLLSALPALVYIGLIVYSVLDCLQTPGEELNRLSRGRWVTVIVLLPLAGALAWLLAGKAGQPSVAGRHERVPSGPNRADGYGWTAEGAAHHPIGPDDDPEFLAGLRAPRRPAPPHREPHREPVEEPEPPDAASKPD